jgi:hypothetical protein
VSLNQSLHVSQAINFVLRVLPSLNPMANNWKLNPVVVRVPSFVDGIVFRLTDKLFHFEIETQAMWQQDQAPMDNSNAFHATTTKLFYFCYE